MVASLQSVKIKGALFLVKFLIETGSLVEQEYLQINIGGVVMITVKSAEIYNKDKGHNIF